MPRFVVTHRCAGIASERERASASRSFEQALKSLAGGISIIEEFEPEDRLSPGAVVFEADASEVEHKQRCMNDDVLLEPQIEFGCHSVKRRVKENEDTHGRILKVLVKGSNGGPLEGAEVKLFSKDESRVQESHDRTSDKGTISFHLRFDPTFAVAEPAGGFWNGFVDLQKSDPTITCSPLPYEGPIAWWHELLGIKEYDDQLGSGIRVGVVDTGSGPHPNLYSAARDSDDLSTHGTHVSGIINARPQGQGEYAGIAPGAALFSKRVFERGIESNHYRIARAIDVLSRRREEDGNEVDLINISLGLARPSEIIHDRIKQAFARGTLCVCSAGNNASEVLDFPASLPVTVAVSAIGYRDSSPPNTISAHFQPDEEVLPARFAGKFFVPMFSSFGNDVFCAGPGSAIISTAPERFGLESPHVSMDGTSMASPAVCGLLAVLLSQSQDYLKSRRNVRARLARRILKAHCRDIGFTDVWKAVVPSLSR